MSMNFGRMSYLQFSLLCLLGVGAGAGIWLFGIQGRGDRNINAKPSAETLETVSKAITVKTAYPRRDDNFQMTVQRPADVEAYYRAELEAQVAGEVKWIRVAPGSQVQKDQLLVRIHVPDKWALMKEKQNFITQRQSEFSLMQEKLNAANVAVKTAEANVTLKKTLLLEAKAETKLREAQFSRLDQLFQAKAQDKNVRDEALRGYEWAQAAEVSADAARIKAEAEVEDARANVRITQAEVNRAKDLIEVAKADYEQIAAITNYAEVKAPFPAAVVSRHVDPGSFVQNASTGHPTPMLTLERSDIVTIVMRVPDNYAPYIAPGTEAVFTSDSLPGLKIRGKVTRFAPSLVTSAHDRTMRVEMDLWNETSDKYLPFFADNKNLAELKDGPLPLLPQFSGKTNADLNKRLLPGMYGNMTLILKAFGQIELIPSQSIVRSGGLTSIYVVQDNKAHLMPVDVLVDDGTLTHVVILGKNGETLGELPDNMQVIISNQEELSEGQPIIPTVREKWGSSKAAHAAP